MLAKFRQELTSPKMDGRETRWARAKIMHRLPNTHLQLVARVRYASVSRPDRENACCLICLGFIWY